ncbi:DUF11 domain-containing protein [Geomonas sp. RF6]|uniref:OmpA family protein n=1 Tax=Geomonas sp. RF6 TaxID=2897342 RepID=UPI001E536EF3|nr:OmpA family protein [Geomonas sp. RF6]UFS68561.1 DUF11 domain-containing protein [Geomonas sp. RF6]
MLRGAHRLSSLGRRVWWGLLLLLSFPPSASPLTPAGTLIYHSFRGSYTSPAQTALSNASVVTVKGLSDPTIVPPRSAASPTGVPIDFLHTITNRANFPDRFLLKVASQRAQAATGVPPCRTAFYSADRKTALVDGDGDGYPETAFVAPGGSLDVVLRVTPAAGSEGVVESFTVTAVSLQLSSASSTVRDQLTVLQAGAWDPPVKSVSPTGTVLPGALLTYTVSFANHNTSPVNSVVITDTLDPHLAYVANSAAFPAGLGGTASFDGASRTVTFQIPAVPAGYEGSVTFQARVSGDTAGYTIANSAFMGSELSDQQVPSNRVENPVTSEILRITKTSTAAAAEAGDIVSYTVRVENVGVAPVSHVTISDVLPSGFRYLKGSSTLNGASLPDPQISGRELIWDIGSVGPGEVRLLSYRTVISVDAPTGYGTNWVRGSGTMPAGSTATATPASATVKIRSSILGDKVVILGRVFADRNGNGVPDAGEGGVAGVRIYLEDGSFVFTDEAGQYSFTGVSAGLHVVKIDSTTLPGVYVPVPYNTAFAGIGWSQFVNPPFGGPVRGDFALAEREIPVAPLVPPPPSLAVPMDPFTLQPPFPPLPPSANPPLAPAAPPAGGAPGRGALLPKEEERVAAQREVAVGPPARLVVTPDRVDIPADSRSTVPFHVEILTRDGKRVAGERLVTVTLAKGAIIEGDAAPELPGYQVLARDGSALFHVRSTALSGQDEMVIALERLRGRVDLYFTSELRDWIVVGLGTFNAGWNSLSGHLEPDEPPDRGIYHDERLAFFSKGKILGKYLLTAAYDSDKVRPDGIFQQIDPEKYYPVYGDASDIGYEAQSNSRFFVKLEAGRSSALVGDYRTDLSENEFSRYDRALNGVKVELKGRYASVTGFESKTSEGNSREEFRGNGTSGYFFLTVKPVLENSERVRVEVRDRYHSEQVLSTAQKLRFGDYTIDYNTGAILFKEPIPSLDRDLNPVYIVVTYQGANGGTERYVYGGRGVLKGPWESVFGGTAVVEEADIKNSTLFGVDGALKIGERISLRGEGAQSDSLERGRGTAWKIDLLANPFDALELGAYYRKVDDSFFNSSMTGSEIGTEKYGGLANWQVGASRLKGESFVQKDPFGTSLFGNEISVQRRFGSFDTEGGFKRIEEEKEGVKGHSDILFAGFHTALTPSLDATVRREQLLSSSPIHEYQTKSQLKLDYRLSAWTHAFLTEEYQEGAPDLRQSTLFGMETRLSDRVRLTTGYQLQRGDTGPSDHANVDVNSTLYREGAFTLNSRTGYQLENALSEERGQAILGLSGRYEIRKGTFLNSTFERVETVYGEGGTGTAFTVAGEYLREEGHKVTGRYEIKDGSGETNSLYGAGIAWKATPSWTLLGKATFWDRDASAGHDRLLDSYLGGSFRPLYDNPWQLLTLARFRIDDKGSVPGGERVRSLVLSSEPTYRINRRWSAQGKYAGKVSWQRIAGEEFQAYTDLFLAGGAYDLDERWELSLYLKLTNQYDTGYHGIGAVGSAGFRILPDVVLLAGYNYSRIDDRDLTGESFQSQGPFVGVKVKFDEQIFQSGERRVQAVPLPAPPPPAAPAAAPAATPAAAPVAAPPPAPAPKAVPVLYLAAAGEDEPLQLSGSAELFTLLVNGDPARLSTSAIKLERRKLAGSVNMKKGTKKLENPVEFGISLDGAQNVARWRFTISDDAGKAVRTMAGGGAPPASLKWEGEVESGTLVSGQIYQYQIELEHPDGSTFASARYLFGVGTDSVIVLSVAGGAFAFDSSKLTPKAKKLLSQVAVDIKAHPKEKVIVEGHTDSIGTERYNMALSWRRCDAAADYLQEVENIPARRLKRDPRGERYPIATNETEEGRSENRRVAIKANFPWRAAREPDDRYRTKPYAIINDRRLDVDEQGRFATAVPADLPLLKVEMGDSQGRVLKTRLPVPALALRAPAGETEVQYGGSTAGYSVDSTGVASCILTGVTNPGNRVEVDGEGVAVAPDGSFSVHLPLKGGENVFGLILRNDSGCSRLNNVRVRSSAKAPALESRLAP